MSESNGHWAENAADFDHLADFWDGLSRLPEPGHDALLDQFVASKNIDIPALVRIGARIAGSKLYFSGKGYIKYRDLVTGVKKTAASADWPKAEFPQLKLAKGRGDSGTVIVCEGETDHARLTMLYPDIDIASMPNGVDTIGKEFGDQLAKYSTVIVATDADEGGERGAARLRVLRPDALRMVPPTNDWCEYDGDPVPLPAPDASVIKIGDTVFEHLDMLEEVPPPTWLMEDLIYDTGVTALAGESGFGKTTVAQWIAGHALEMGRHVFWLDHEAGKVQTHGRARALGWASFADIVAERFHYAYNPRQIEPHLPQIAKTHPGALVVIDSMSKALAQYGLSENDASEVTRWTVHIIALAKDHGLPVLLIDHTGKKAGDENRYGRGSSAKLADADTQFIVERHKTFSQHQQGTVCLRCVKDRLGWIEEKHWFNVGDGNGRLTFEPTDGPDNQDEEVSI